MLTFIIDEIKSPYKDPRVSRLGMEMNDEQLFYKLIKQSPETFKKYMIISGEIEKIGKDEMLVRLPETGLWGSLHRDNIDMSLIDQDKPMKLKKRNLANVDLS